MEAVLGKEGEGVGGFKLTWGLGRVGEVLPLEEEGWDLVLVLQCTMVIRKLLDLVP